jgi:hypothetical protein
LTFQQLKYINNLFIVSENYNTLITSPDGVNWNTHLMLGGGMNTIYTFAYGADLYVAFCNSTQDSVATTIITSSDGVNWANRDLSEGTKPIHDVIYANNLLVTVGDSGTIITSQDGKSWTKRTSRTTYQLAYVI